MLAYGLRANIMRNVRTSVRTKTLKKTSLAKIVRTRAERVNIRANKQLEKNRSCEHRANGANNSSKFHFWQKFDQKNAQFCPKICIFKFLTENCMGLLKKPDSDKNSPDFTQQPAHLSFCMKIARVCPETLAEQTSDRKSRKPAHIDFLPGVCKVRHCHPYFDPNNQHEKMTCTMFGKMST